MKKPFEVEGVMYETEEEASKVIRDILKIREDYPFENTGIYRDLQDLKEGFVGLYKGVYVHKPVYKRRN